MEKQSKKVLMTGVQLLSALPPVDSEQSVKNLYVNKKNDCHSLSKIEDLFANAIYDFFDFDFLYLSEMLRMNLSMTKK